MEIQKNKKPVAKKPVAKKPSVKLATDAQKSPYSNTGFLYSGVPSKGKNGKSIKKAQKGTVVKKAVNSKPKAKNSYNMLVPGGGQTPSSLKSQINSQAGQMMKKGGKVSKKK